MSESITDVPPPLKPGMTVFRYRSKDDTWVASTVCEEPYKSDGNWFVKVHDIGKAGQLPLVVECTDVRVVDPVDMEGLHSEIDNLVEGDEGALKRITNRVRGMLNQSTAEHLGDDVAERMRRIDLLRLERGMGVMVQAKETAHLDGTKIPCTVSRGPHKTDDGWRIEVQAFPGETAMSVPLDDVVEILRLPKSKMERPDEDVPDPSG